MSQKLIEGLKKLNLTFSENQISQLTTYIEEILTFNQSYNIMKADTPDELAVNHILDSLVAVPHLQKLIENLSKNAQISPTSNEILTLEIADIGSGGGCPGIPLAISFPNHHFTLVERMEKRCDFLSAVVQKLNLPNVTIENKAVDMVEKEKFDIEVFRAFHPFDLKITNLLLRMLKKGGYIAAYKAREEKILAEMQTISKLVKSYDKIKLTVPFLEDHERNLVVFRK